MTELRKFYTPKPEWTTEKVQSMLADLSYVHDVEHFELFYNMIFRDLDWSLPDHMRPVAYAINDPSIKQTMVIISPGAGKAIHPDTPILSKFGWIPIKDLQIGTEVYGPDGNLSTVLGKYIQPQDQLYRVNFIDGRSILTNKDHLWATHNKHFLKRGFKGKENTPKEFYWRVRTTQELSLNLSSNKGAKWYIPLTAPINYPIAELPLNSYVLGCLLGDGHLGNNGFPILTSFDSEIVNHIKELGYSVSDYNKGGRDGLTGLWQIIKNLELDGSRSWNKAIPNIYKYSSIDQRFALLQGLLDTDGTVGRHKDISFTSTSEQLAKDVQELVWSLGGIAKITTKQGKYKKKDKYLICRLAYRVGIRFPEPEKLFYLKRKQVSGLDNQYSDTLKLEIKSIVPEEVSDSVCITVDHPSHLFITKDYLVTHNSQLVDVAFPAWELGYDPNMTILSLSAGADLPVEFMQSTMNLIEENTVYRTVFPQVVPDTKRGWSSSKGIFVKGSAVGRTSPSYSALGYKSSYVTGKHARILILDDIHDPENAGSSDQIDKLETFYYTTIIGRQDPQGTRMVIIGRRWTEDDLYGRLKKSGDWLVMTLATLREGDELYYDVQIPANLACVFNNFKAIPEVEHIKVVYGKNEEQPGFYWIGQQAKYIEAIQVKKNKPDIFETVYQSNPESAGRRLFEKEDFVDFHLPEQMYMGRNYDVVAQYLHNMNFDMILQTIDTALTDESVNDPSCIYTLGLKGCTKEHKAHDPLIPDTPFHYDIYVLDEVYKRLGYENLVTEVVDYHNLWMPNYLLVEKSAAGIPLINSLGSFSIQVLGVVVQHTSKRSRVINGAKTGSAQGWAKLGRIHIPTNAPWANSLLNELKEFTGSRNKRDDRVDALVQGVNFAIDLGVQSRDLPLGWRDKEDIDAKLLSWATPNHPLLQLPHLYGNVQNPFYGLCGTCRMYDDKKRYCNLHKRPMVKIASCPMYDPTQESTLSISYGTDSPSRKFNFEEK
jgi:predicted phage terminase large subunit-like protein